MAVMLVYYGTKGAGAGDTKNQKFTTGKKTIEEYNSAMIYRNINAEDVDRIF